MKLTSRAGPTRIERVNFLRNLRAYVYVRVYASAPFVDRQFGTLSGANAAGHFDPAPVRVSFLIRGYYLCFLPSLYLSLSFSRDTRFSNFPLFVGPHFHRESSLVSSERRNETGDF